MNHSTLASLSWKSSVSQPGLGTEADTPEVSTVPSSLTNEDDTMM